MRLGFILFMAVIGIDGLALFIDMCLVMQRFKPFSDYIHENTWLGILAVAFQLIGVAGLAVYCFGFNWGMK